MKKILLNMFAVLVFVLTMQLSASAQGTYNICSITTTLDSTGTLYDTGGPNDVYVENENCTLLVSPPCATSITLTFTQFMTESGFDFFNVYDGTTIAAPQLLNASGTTIPGPVTCTSGSMLIIWRSDVTIVDSGFACTWTSVIAPSTTPTAAFSIGNTNPPLLTNVQFTDLSAGGPVRWLWDFGDGDTSWAQNPLHAFATSGTFTVTLVAFSCSQSDTTTLTLNVQQPPQISVSPDSLTANVLCGDTVTFNLGVSNIGGGQLVYSTDGSTTTAVRVLAMTYGTDLFSEFPATIAAINQYFTNYTLTTTATTSPGTLQGLLTGKNVLLIPEQELGDPAVWTSLGAVIRQFLNNGGSVIWCGSFSSGADCMFNTGVFAGNYFDNSVGNSLTVSNPAHPLAVGLDPTFTAPSATFAYNITDIDKEQIIIDGTNDIVTTRPFGSGKAIFIGFDYYATSVNSSKTIANAIHWGGQNGIASWITLSRNTDTVTAVGTSNIIVTFKTTGLAAGTYISNISISSNDPLNPTVLVPCTLTVSGDPAIALSSIACLDFDTIMQHTSASQTFDIINNGCDTLHINSLTSTMPTQFVATSPDSYVLPGGFMTVTVTFNSALVGNYSGEIQIDNNDIDTVICVLGSTFAAPAIATNPGSITENLRACGVSNTKTFTIDNTGGTDLTFSLGATPAWLVAAPTSGTVPAGGSTTITLNFSSGTLVGAQYTAALNINSNDPLNSNVTVSCVLNVDINPCVDYTYTTNTCSGEFDFTATSINTPTTWTWDFGDSTSSTVQNPSHQYAANGSFDVTLIACNAAGCDTTTQTVLAVITGPKPTTCYPVTTAYCCGIGITNVHIGTHPGAIDNTTFDAI
ncbi:MAG: PKD domain-containing protein, partial [Bacteroidia bacterium]|nr:PKD domain-containing protein [Bacteroidia bacterium]